ncbi:protein-methionine-sulfoxide reductase heme-binding subunit MsrQ [Ruegeria sp. WL0004]|uniref:Protein-methionine-sulfoxide reductase heme-binding subunit MsrQ n=1 Tax=Ruegeria marisflavi TaxID=2984152 RepID=A0ABT2WT67_9RHOB|nr:protein-methionine-sulfoxide reductase heme-binding subunit MsrQ [Ruegeria sp. WL0004]MCU9838867.1 protein-methionine-sulfoxide reductase heme-binding subunit MsrQ [Ruegeria sp. WL0004]
MDRVNGYLRRVPVWLVYTVGVLPVPIWLWLGINGQLGIDPVKEIEHRLGELALQALLFGLAITPLRRYLRLNLIKFRRAIGVLAFYYVSCHLLVWLVLDVQIPAQIWADIVKRPYITIGMAAFALLLPLAVTSNNWSVRLGNAWRRLHRLVYPAVLLGAIHYLMLVKGFQFEPLIYLGMVLLLLGLRLPDLRRRTAL